jgi:4-oxalmesaconate hydratase
MIIDVHAHTVASPNGPGAASSLYSPWAGLEAAGVFGGPPQRPAEAELLGGAETQIRLMDEVGTDIQLTSPRPYLLKHSHRVSQVVHWWCQLNNDAIATQAKAFPDRIRGVAALPQVAGRPIDEAIPELDRCINELGFVGIIVNPDPSEGAGTSPLLSDEYWYPLYSRLVALDVPMLIHAAGCFGRETYSEHFISEESLAVTSLIRGRVLDRFPDLKVIVPHGGGSIPYQVGRWMAHAELLNDPPFDEALKRLWFDTCIYTKDALELLISTVGSTRVVFGTERPGSGHGYEDIKPVIDSIADLDASDRTAIYESNARHIYSRLS